MKSDDGTVLRVLNLLRALAESEEAVSLKALSQSLRLAPSTTHRLLERLAGEGFAERAPGRRYRVGREFSRVGTLAGQRMELVEVVRPVMREVVAACDETCLLGVYLPVSAKMSFVEKVDSSHALRYRVKMYRQRSLLWGASGRAILAWLPDDEAERAISAGTASPASGRPLPSADVLREQLAEIRARGYAITQGQQTAGAVGIAAPIFGPGNRVVGDLCITIPEHRFQRRMEPRIAALIVSGARRVAAHYGGERPQERKVR